MTFDMILAARVADIKNQLPAADVSQGSVLFLEATRGASAEWGLRKYIDTVVKNFFPDTADTQALERHAFVHGLMRKTGETDAALLVRLLKRLQSPPSGGTKTDYETWAGEVDGVGSALCIPTARGAGTVDVVILADASITGSETPTDVLLAAVADHIDSVRPVTVKNMHVLAPQFIIVDVVLNTTGATASAKTAAATAISSYMTSLAPGATLFTSKLVQLAIEAGVPDAVVISPATNVTASKYQVIRGGTGTIN